MMGWLTEKLKYIMGKSEPPELPEPKSPEFPYGETQGLIGEAVAEYIPSDAIRKGSVLDINVLISGHQDLTEIHLKMRIDSGLCVQMMEYPQQGGQS